LVEKPDEIPSAGYVGDQHRGLHLTRRGSEHGLSAREIPSGEEGHRLLLESGNIGRSHGERPLICRQRLWIPPKPEQGKRIPA